LIIPPEIAAKLSGKTTDALGIQQLRSALPANLVPEWFVDMLRECRLSGVMFSISKEEDVSGLGADVIWLSTDQIISEAFEAEPGISVTPLGLLPIGDCAIGSGDPYFLDLRHNSDDPQVVRVPHDYAVEQPYPLQNIEVVCPTLSAFFSKAVIK
jgi:hypothetical protein